MGKKRQKDHVRGNGVVMAIFCAAAAAVWLWIAEAAAAVYAAMAIAITAVVLAIQAAAIYLYSAITGIIAGLIEGVGLISWDAMNAALVAVNANNAIALEYAVTTMRYALYVKATWLTFAEVIHLKTLLKIHSVALLVSGNYRNAMRQFYSDVSRLSHALNLGAHFLPLAIRNARALVLDASTTFGRSYDLAEITWLTDLSAWANKIQKKAAKYENNPGLVFEDLDRWLIAPAMNAKSSAMIALYSSVDATLNTVTQIIDDVITVKDDLQKLVADLPKNVRIWARPLIDDIIKPFSEFIEKDYKPAITALDGVITVVQQSISENKAEAARLIQAMIDGTASQAEVQKAYTAGLVGSLDAATTLKLSAQSLLSAEEIAEVRTSTIAEFAVTRGLITTEVSAVQAEMDLLFEEEATRVSAVIGNVMTGLTKEITTQSEKIDSLNAVVTGPMTSQLNAVDMVADSIMDSMKMPVDILERIDVLPSATREEQEEKLYQLVSRIPDKARELMDIVDVKTEEGLKAVRDILNRPIEFSPWEVKTIKKLIAPGETFPDDADAWSVGDF